jgi:hypothetical protein
MPVIFSRNCETWRDWWRRFNAMLSLMAWSGEIIDCWEAQLRSSVITFIVVSPQETYSMN